MVWLGVKRTCQWDYTGRRGDFGGEGGRRVCTGEGRRWELCCRLVTKFDMQIYWISWRPILALVVSCILVMYIIIPHESNIIRAYIGLISHSDGRAIQSSTAKGLWSERKVLVERQLARITRSYRFEVIGLYSHFYRAGPSTFYDPHPAQKSHRC